MAVLSKLKTDNFFYWKNMKATIAMNDIAIIFFYSEGVGGVPLPPLPRKNIS